MMQSGGHLTAFRLFLYSVITVGTVFYIYQTLDLFANPTVLSGVEYGGLGFRLLFAVVVTPASIVMGILVIRRVPENIIGFLLLLYAISLAGIWTRADVDTQGVRELYLLSNYSVGTLSTLLFAGFLYYFPSGKVYPVRMTGWVNAGLVLTWTGGFIQLLATHDLSITHGELLQFSNDMTNPFFVPILGDYLSLIRLTIGIGSISWIVFIVGGLVSTVMRYRRGNDAERQKIKWIMWFAILGIASFPMWVITSQISEVAFNTWAVIFFAVWYPMPVVAIAIAILRHRLYDIDIIIRRTLIYAVLTTILGVVYFGGIVLTQQAFVALTGQTSELAIVVSTLLIAALFAPLRRRVQDVIDQRLYRKKYDVEQVLADFQKNLRDEVDMETLKANLIGVVSETMQPDKIALWVKEPGKPPTP